jgi:hypothetical protein
LPSLNYILAILGTLCVRLKLAERLIKYDL